MYIEKVQLQQVKCFENITLPCIESFGGVGVDGKVQKVGDIAVNQDVDTYLFWDYVHPTTKGHQMLATYLYQTLFPLHQS